MITDAFVSENDPDRNEADCVTNDDFVRLRIGFFSFRRTDGCFFIRSVIK